MSKKENHSKAAKAEKAKSFLGGSVLWAISTLIALAATFYLATNFTKTARNQALTSGHTSIFEFQVDSIDENNPISLSEFKGKKAYLVVNVASQCGLTKKNYAELNQLYEKYQFEGLEILAFPCDNFGKQEPACNADILEFATKEKGALFPILGKLECDNHTKTHPLYQFLKASLDGGFLGQGLKWNFSKFLCDANGVPIKRYLPITSPMALEKDVVDLLTNGKIEL